MYSTGQEDNKTSKMPHSDEFCGEEYVQEKNVWPDLSERLKLDVCDEINLGLG